MAKPEETELHVLADIADILCDSLLHHDDLPTLRDRFAMAALTGLVASTSGPNDLAHDTAPQVVAEEAYRIADAMLKERSK